MGASEVAQQAPGQQQKKARRTKRRKSRFGDFDPAEVFIDDHDPPPPPQVNPVAAAAAPSAGAAMQNSHQSMHTEVPLLFLSRS